MKNMIKKLVSLSLSVSGTNSWEFLGLLIRKYKDLSMWSFKSMFEGATANLFVAAYLDLV